MKKLTVFTLTITIWASGMLSAAALEAAPKMIRIAAMGDIMLGPEASADAFAEVKPFLAGRQVVIGNLEGPLTDRGIPAKVFKLGISYVFRSRPAIVNLFNTAGFTIMNLANNHVNDYGRPGSQQTRELLNQAGLLYTGAKGEVARQKVGQTIISVIGLSPNRGCQNLNDIPAAAALVRQEAKKPNTLVVVTFHGGAEGPSRVHVPRGREYYLGENRGNLRRLGRAMIDAGAHLVIGHGPHVPRGLELYKDRLIAYSLGNFATGKGLSISGRNGLAPLLLVDLTLAGKLAGGQIISFKQKQPGRPALDQNHEAMKLMHALSLMDFDSPGLGPDGKILTTDSAARTMAAARPKSEPASAEAGASTKKSGQKPKRKTAPNPPASSYRYEWELDFR